MFGIKHENIIVLFMNHVPKEGRQSGCFSRFSSLKAYPNAIAGSHAWLRRKIRRVREMEEMLGGDRWRSVRMHQQSVAPAHLHTTHVPQRSARLWPVTQFTSNEKLPQRVCVCV